MTRPAAVVAALLAALVLAAAGAPAVRADADPASDTLISGQDLFLPYQPEVSTPLKLALTKLVADARAAGSITQVALIASNLDLGAVPDFYAHPQQYATFLAQELGTPKSWGLLVVMPQGIGYVGPSPLAAQLRGRPVMATVAGHTDSDVLARAAGLAVVDIARDAGHPLANVPAQITHPSEGGGGSSGLLVVGLIVALVLVLAGVIGLRVRAARGADRGAVGPGGADPGGADPGATEPDAADPGAAEGGAGPIGPVGRAAQGDESDPRAQPPGQPLEGQEPGGERR